MKQKGIVLIAIGKRGYSFAAYNMAVSIKHFNPSLPVAVLTDGLKQLYNEDVFDDIIQLPEEMLYHKQQFTPAKAKIYLYDYLPYKENLYLDVDGLALQDLTPLFKHFKGLGGYYYTDVMDTGGKDDQIAYNMWADTAVSWPFFKLKKDAIWPAIQSSYCYIKRGKDAQAFFKKAQGFFEKGFPLEDLNVMWGGSLPDELIFSGTCASIGLVPDGKIDMLFYGKEISPLTYNELQERYHILSLWGNGTGGKRMVRQRYVQWYDTLMRKVYLPGSHIYKSMHIMKDKWVNKV